MKAIILAASVLAVGATAASAQFAPRPWMKSDFPYAERHHRMCQEKAWRLHSFERRAASDGELSWRERRIIRSLRADLDSTCGRFRWRG